MLRTRGPSLGGRSVDISVDSAKHSLGGREASAVRFKVGVTIGRASGGGSLTVEPGKIVLSPDPLLQRVFTIGPVVQTHPSAVVLRPRLAPPWFNTHLQVVGEDGRRGVASTTAVARPKLRAALADAGFAVTETRTWFANGIGRLRREYWMWWM